MKALTVVSVLLLALACQAPPPQMTEMERAQLEAETRDAIMERWATYESTASDMTLEAWLSYWAPDARIMEPGMDMSGEEIASFGAEFFEGGGEVFDLDLDSYEIWTHGDVAYQIGQYDETFQLPGQERMEVQRFFFARWKKGPDGVWKIDRFMAGPRNALEGG